MVTIRPKDPAVMTLLIIKQLLRKRCKLRRTGKVLLDNEPAVKIDELISRLTKSTMIGLTTASPKKLWREINDVYSGGQKFGQMQ